MMWWIVVLASAGLIVLGITLLVRDMLSSRPGTAKSSGPGKPVAKAKIKSLPKSWPLTNAIAAAWPTQMKRAAIGGNAATEPPIETVAIENVTGANAANAPRLPALEKHWPRLKSEIDAAVASVNQTMAPLALSIAVPGEATWSLHNQGYGDYRRVFIDGESIAWLRLEIGADLRITCRLRAHDAEHYAVNRDCSAPARRTAGQLVQSLTEVLAAVFEYAVWRHSHILRNDTASAPAPDQPTPAPPPSLVAEPPPARTTTAPLTRQPPRTAASPAAVLVDAAITLVNKAFADAGAQLLPSEDQRGRTTLDAARSLSIIAHGHSVGLMLIEPRADRIDISVGVADLANIQAARRQSQPMAGLTVHALAEAIATNAWPAIAAASTPAQVA